MGGSKVLPKPISKLTEFVAAPPSGSNINLMVTSTPSVHDNITRMSLTASVSPAVLSSRAEICTNGYYNQMMSLIIHISCPQTPNFFLPPSFHATLTLSYSTTKKLNWTFALWCRHPGYKYFHCMWQNRILTWLVKKLEESMTTTIGG